MILLTRVVFALSFMGYYIYKGTKTETSLMARQKTHQVCEKSILAAIDHKSRNIHF